MRRFLLTPVKNEAHLLKFFIEYHTAFFDNIIIADQGSTDGSWEIASSHPNVIAIQNPDESYSENLRRILLLNEARKLDPNALLVGLDADEFLLVDPNRWKDYCDEWMKTYRNHSISFRWMSLKQGGVEWFTLQNTFCRLSLGGLLPEMTFHQPRVPIGPKSFFCEDICVLHLHLLWPRRQQMKTWWYAALEAYTFGSVSLDTRRLYIQTGRSNLRNCERIPVMYQKTVVAILESINLSDTWDTWHKSQILDLLCNDSSSNLSNAPIWDFPWSVEIAANGLSASVNQSLLGLVLDFWIKSTIKTRHTFIVRSIDAFLRLLPVLRSSS